jgi:hypothetical protein
MAHELPRKTKMTKGPANFVPLLQSTPQAFLVRSRSCVVKNVKIADQVPIKNIAVTVAANRARRRRYPRHFASQKKAIMADPQAADTQKLS